MSRHDAIVALDRIDPTAGAFIEIDADRVLKAAESHSPGRLSGILIAVKDLVDTAGVRTTYGSDFFADHVPENNAPIIDALESEGAIVLGKTNLNEFAYGVSGYNPHYGAILTPRDHSRTAGGSSGGSAAAVSAGVCRLAVGTDTSGSVRVPAACCGIYGFKSARGSFSLDGIFPLAPSFDSVGFFSLGVQDLQLILGIDDLPEPANLRVARLGDDIEVPRLPDEHWVLFRKEVWEVHGERYRRQPQRYGRDLRWKLELPIGDIEEAEQTLARWSSRFMEVVAEVDVLVGPALDGAAPKRAAAVADYERDEFLVGERLLRHTPVYNQLGWPALVVPTADGPIQVAARPGNESAILAVALDLGLPATETVAG